MMSKNKKIKMGDKEIVLMPELLGSNKRFSETAWPFEIAERIKNGKIPNSR